ncbi:MAG: hypothetical protein ACM3XS_10450 [Bacteroidota bacterium]
MRRRILITLWCLAIAGGGVRAAGQSLPLDHWVYGAMRELHRADLLPDYPAEWIGAGHPLTRHELAYYLRGVILLLGRNDREKPALSPTAETTLSRLIQEFQPELRALGVNVQPTETTRQFLASHVDLDQLLAVLTRRPDPPAPVSPPAATVVGAGTGPLSAQTYQMDLVPGELTIPSRGAAETWRGPLNDFATRPENLIGLASQYLGRPWSLSRDAEPFQEILGLPLRIGGYLLSDERADIQGGIGLRVGEQTALGLDTLWFVDLDRAESTMNRLLLDVNTKVELNERLGIFGQLALDYRPDLTSLRDLGSQASAGLRLQLGGDSYFIAQYSLANPFSESLPRWQSTAVGLTVSDFGLLLLGLQTSDFTTMDRLELTLESIYHF